ncbi:MAG TPA: efflux RND transporter periplasmic adaptor subunit [Gammaproteobacteria bacterium]|nr:efflux RND transporter periplasmic adaptor subunit [Gammaproteobacteria bacterium]
MFEQAVSEVKQKKICFVDDSRDSRYSAKRFLKQRGCAVDYFPGAAAALESVTENTYDLLIVDLMSADETNKFIHRVRQQALFAGQVIPVIIISSSDKLGVYHEALADGMCKVLLKPYTDEALHQAMQALTPKIEHFGSQASAGRENIVKMKSHPDASARQSLAKKRDMSNKAASEQRKLSHISDTHRDAKPMAEIDDLNEEMTTVPFSAIPIPDRFENLEATSFEEEVDVPPMSMMESIQQTLSENKRQTKEEIVSPLSTVKKTPVVEPIVLQKKQDSTFDVETVKKTRLNVADKPAIAPIPMASQKIEPLQKNVDGNENSAENSVPGFAKPALKPKQQNTSSMTKAKGALSKLARLTLFVLMIASGATYWYLSQLPVQVNVVTVQQAAIFSEISVPGRVMSKRNINVITRAAGQVVEVNVKEGDSVSKGQTLVRLDDKEAQNDIKRIKARLAASQAEVEAANKTYKRLRNALEFGAVTRRIVDDAEAAWKFVSAKQTEIEEELVGAEVKLDRMSIKAPFSGVVGSVFIQEEQWLSQAEKVLNLVDVSQRVVDIPMKVADSARLNIGQEISLASEDFNGESWKEKILRIGKRANAEDSDSDMVSVQSSLGRNLRIGQQVDARIRVASKNNALLLPHKVLFTHDGSAHVAVIEKGEIVFIPVVTGIESVKQVEITKGVHAGQEVVDPSGLRLEAGMNVMVN